MILSSFIVFFCFRCFIANLVLQKKYALFGANLFCLKLGLYKENYIFHVCVAGLTTYPTKLIEVCHTWGHKQPLCQGPVLHCGKVYGLNCEIYGCGWGLWIHTDVGGGRLSMMDGLKALHSALYSVHSTLYSTLHLTFHSKLQFKYNSNLYCTIPCC